MAVERWNMKVSWKLKMGRIDGLESCFFSVSFSTEIFGCSVDS